MVSSRLRECTPLAGLFVILILTSALSVLPLAAGISDAVMPVSATSPASPGAIVTLSGEESGAPGLATLSGEESAPPRLATLSGEESAPPQRG